MLYKKCKIESVERLYNTSKLSTILYDWCVENNVKTITHYRTVYWYAERYIKGLIDSGKVYSFLDPTPIGKLREQDDLVYLSGGFNTSEPLQKPKKTFLSKILDFLLFTETLYDPEETNNDSSGKDIWSSDTSR